MLNVNFIGRLGADAEEKVSKAGNHFITMRVAVDGYANGEKTTDWVRVTYVGERALKMREFFTKGKAVFVTGQAKIDTYQLKTGEWTSSFDVIADRIDFVNTGGSGQQQGEGAATPAAATATTPKVSMVNASPMPAKAPEAAPAPAPVTVSSVSEAVTPAKDPFADVEDDLPF